MQVFQGNRSVVLDRTITAEPSYIAGVISVVVSLPRAIVAIFLGNAGVAKRVSVLTSASIAPVNASLKEDPVRFRVMGPRNQVIEATQLMFADVERFARYGHCF